MGGGVKGFPVFCPFHMHQQLGSTCILAFCLPTIFPTTMVGGRHGSRRHQRSSGSSINAYKCARYCWRPLAPLKRFNSADLFLVPTYIRGGEYGVGKGKSTLQATQQALALAVP